MNACLKCRCCNHRPIPLCHTALPILERSIHRLTPLYEDFSHFYFVLQFAICIFAYANLGCTSAKLSKNEFFLKVLHSVCTNFAYANLDCTPSDLPLDYQANSFIML